MLKDLCFEVIKTCPNNCLFCSSCSSPDAKTLISFDLFKQTIDHFISLGGIEEISLSGGEPLLHPNIFEMIAYCKEKNIRTVLFTSGIKRNILIDKNTKEQIETFLKKKYQKFEEEGLEKDKSNKLYEKELSILIGSTDQFRSINTEEIAKLKELGLDKIVFDFQASTPEIYNQIMGTKNYYTHLATSLIRATTAGLNTDVHFIPTKINYQELPDLIELLNIANCENLSILNFVPQGRGEENKDKLLLSQEQMQEFVKIYENSVSSFNGTIRIGIPLIKNDTHLCTAGLSKLVIKYDGTVLPCPAFKEYDITALNKIGIKTPNIHTELSKVKVYSGSRKSPLCKKLYNFQNYIKKEVNYN